MNPEHHNINTGGGQPPGSSEVRKIEVFCVFLSKFLMLILMVISVSESKSAGSTAAAS